MVAQVSGGADTRAAAAAAPDPQSTDMVDQLTQQLASMGESRKKLVDQRDQASGGLGNLKSPEGILSLLTLLAGAATGNTNLAAAGVGGATGSMSPDQGSIAAADAGIKAIDKQRGDMGQRVTTLLSSQPGMFVNPDDLSSSVDPRLLGVMVSGMPIPIDPGANFVIKRDGEEKKRQYDAGLQMLRSDDPYQRSMGAVMVNNTLDLGWSEEQMQTLGNVDESQLLVNLMTASNLDPLSVGRAWIYHMRSGKPITDPDVVTLMEGKKAGEINIEQRHQDLLTKFGTAIQNAGSEMLRQPIETQLAYAFSDQPGELTEMKRWLMGTRAFAPGLDPQDLANGILSSGFNMLQLYAIAPQLFSGMDINSEGDVWKYTARNAGTMIQNLQEKSSHEIASELGFDMTDLSILYGKNGVDTEEARPMAMTKILELRDQATENGVFDAAKYKELLKKERGQYTGQEAGK